MEGGDIQKNTWNHGLFEENSTHIVIFPFAQHFLSDSQGFISIITTKEELDGFVKNIDFSEIPKYSSKNIRTIFKLSHGVTLLIIVILTILLLIQ